MILIITTILLSVSLVSASDNNNFNDSDIETSDASNFHILSDSNNKDLSGNVVTKSTEKSDTEEKNILSNQVTNTTTSNITDNINSTYNSENIDTSLNSIDNSTSQVVEDDSLSLKGSAKSTNNNLLTASNKLNVNIDMDSYSVLANQTVTFKANLTYSNGVKVDGKTVVFKVNNITIGSTKVNKGVASLKYTIPNWKANLYKLSITIGETSSSYSATTTSTLYVKQKVSISMNSYSVRQNGTITISATFTNQDGTMVDGSTVVFKVNDDVTIGSTNINNGVASLTFTPTYNIGKYNLTVKIGETYKGLASVKNSTLTITSGKTSKINTINSTYIKKGDCIVLTSVVKDTSGNTITSGRVTYLFDSKNLGTVSISGGVAKYKFNTTTHTYGNHNITVTFNGNTVYNPSNTTTSLRIISGKTFTYNQLLNAANRTKTFIESNHRLPNYITIASEQVKPQDLLYLFAKVLYTNNSLYSGFFDKSNNTQSTNCFGDVIYKEEYIANGKSIVSYYDTYGKSPLTFNSSVGRLSFDDAVYLYARAVAYIYNNGMYPNFCWVWDSSNGQNSSSSSSSGSSTTTNKVPSGYESYVKTTKNCQVDSSVIKSVLNSAIKGVSGLYNQAKAIFNYINDKTDYSYYYDTYRGAVKTWNDRKGNCCDLAHLVIAVARANNIPSRYCHATCYFTSGLTTGHVWAELYVNGQWYSCDATSNRNSFDVINNWYNCGSIRRYTELPF